MQRYLRLRAVPALLFIVAAASPCWSFSLHPSPALPGSFSPATSCVFPSASSHVGAAARRGGGVVGLGMKRKNGASGQQQGLPGGRDGGGRGSEKVAGARADQKYAYVQGGFAERQAPTQGNNTSMYSAFDSALRASSYNMFCSPLKPVSAPSAFQATKVQPCFRSELFDRGRLQPQICARGGGGRAAKLPLADHPGWNIMVF